MFHTPAIPVYIAAQKLISALADVHKTHTVGGQDLTQLLYVCVTVSGWNRVRFLLSAALSVHRLSPHAGHFLRKTPGFMGIYAAAEHMDLPIRPCLCEPSAPQRHCYCTL